MEKYEITLKIIVEAGNDDEAQDLAQTAAENMDEFLEDERGEEFTEIEMVQEVKP